jgi:ferredoxin
MEQLFTTCLLVKDKGSPTELIQAQINLHPGSSFSADQGKNVLLAGGFPALSPDSKFFLSSTLFVNSSLAKHGLDVLLQIALAELKRKNSIDFRSYTLEPDNRVAVIGNNASDLLSFMDSYGGVLQIEPLLLKGCHPDLPTVSELVVIHQKNSCRLEYQIRSPIDLQRCSYCGACGPACPEGCIDEKLFLDYARCTLCRQCEPVCPTGAIDVHAVQLHIMEAPAVILLGSLQLEEAGPLVFREEELPRYFATLFPTRIEELVTWNKSLCQYSGRLGDGCTLCLTSCRVSAITQDSNGVQVNPIACEECGACVGVCPTGALQYEKFTDLSFHQYIKSFPSLHGTTVVVGTDTSLHRLWWLGREQAYPDTFFIGFERLQALSLYHFLTFASCGAARVIVLDQEQPGDVVQLELANIFLQKLFDRPNFVCRISPEDMAEQGVVSAAPAMPPIPTTMADVLYDNRRQSVAASLEYLVTASGRNVELRSHANLPFGTIHCDENRCTQCGACLNDCNIRALSTDAETLTLNYVGALCVACGVCVKTCPEKALSISPSFTLAAQYFVPVKLAQAEPMACKKCGKVFGTKKSFARVMAILTAKESVDTSHFEYCDNCRVIKIFEEQ